MSFIACITLGILIGLGITLLAGIVWCAALDKCWPNGLGRTIVLTSTIITLVSLYDKTQAEIDAKAKAKTEAEEAIKRRTPHIIRQSPDGCQTFRFEADGMWHYYTKCPQADVTHEAPHKVTERRGKSTTTKTVYESTTTTGG